MIHVNPSVWTTSFSIYPTSEHQYGQLPKLGGFCIVGIHTMIRESDDSKRGAEFYFQSVRAWIPLRDLHLAHT